MKNTNAGKHTQGEWYAEAHDNDGCCEITCRIKQTILQRRLNTTTVRIGKIYNPKDAKLIAAAPDMLKALETAQEYIKILTKDLHGEARESKIIKAAINKAKGL